ncbi:MAG: flagellar hook-basal body protein [Desulfobacterota bacterium]|nr:flagellar hook-basal body protein [Thermodesulfobacteriota bacterium]
MKEILSGISGLVDGTLIQQLRCDTVSNNLANLSTKGFKRDVLSFDEVLTQKMHSAPDFSQGPVQHTGNSFDLALDGPGFFKVQTRHGLRYTRDGALGLDRENTLVNRNGDPVLGDNGPIRVEGTDVSMGADGQIRVDGASLDRILVVDFKDRRLLLKEGANYYIDPGTAEELPRPEKTTLHQGYLEESNVDLTEEMIRMVEAFRAFEAMQKGIQSIDEMTGKLINDPGLF